MDPIIGGALIVGAGGLLDSIFGSSSTSSANKANIQIARETNQANKDIAQMNNEFNERMLERQIGYNTEMWNKQNAYNTPEAQAQRMRDAGFNPYLSGVNNTAAGDVGSITTRPPYIKLRIFASDCNAFSYNIFNGSVINLF